MIDNETMRKLGEMKMSGMAEQFRLQSNDPVLQKLSFEERFGLLVDAEWTRRKNNRLNRLIRNAEFPINDACVEGVEYFPDRKLDMNLIARLSACQYIAQQRGVILLGAAGSGKTYLSNALGMAACRNHHTVRYIRLPDLLIDMEMARRDGTYKRVMKQYKRLDLLIIDEWLLVPMDEASARDLLEIIEARHQSGSTILCSQFAPAGWHERLGEATLADAILDRIVHNSYIITIEGRSMRERKGIAAMEKRT